MKFVKTEYGNNKSILKYVDHYVNVPIMVSDSGISADAEGKKIVKAGSFLNASGAIVSDATAAGVLFYDVDVTHGDAPGAILIHGFVDVTKLPVQPTDEVKTALKLVQFC